MHRAATEYLIGWMDSLRRKPLVLRGARQVGKSYLARTFARSHFRNLVEINFEESPDLGRLFEAKSPDQIVPRLELHSGSKIIPVEIKAGKTGRLKSLHMFLREKMRSFGVRFNTDVPSLLDTEAALPSGETMPYRLLSLPLYLFGQTRRLCERHGTS